MFFSIFFLKNSGFQHRACEGTLIASIDKNPTTNEVCGVMSMRRCLQYLVSILVSLSAAGCVAAPTNQSNNNLRPPASPAASVPPSPVNETAAKAEPLTLPVLDAFFAEEGFSALLRTR